MVEPAEDLMGRSGRMWTAVLIACTVAAVAEASAVDTGGGEAAEAPGPASYHVPKVASFQWGPRESSYQYVWPHLEFGWRIVVGSIIAFLGSVLGTVGGVGGGGIYVPMLTLIIGFDAKSSAAISKCMIMSAAGSTVWYNLKLRHPNLDMPIIDYDLALLFQPMLMLGISIGVAFSVIFADWMVTVLLIIVFIMASTKATSKGIHAWKKETIEKKEEAMLGESNESAVIDYTALPSGPANLSIFRTPRKEASILENVYWKELGLLCFVWVAFLIVQENFTATCSLWYWILNLIQVPVSVGVSGYEAVSLYRGERRIASKGEEGTNFTVFQLVSYCTIGCLAGAVAGLLGLGGGFILVPLFLELNIPPQVSGATATFAMTFSSSMSVIEYYLLKRFPVPFALYFVGVALVAAFVGQHVVKRIVEVIGRASLLIFILSLTIFVSAISLGGAGISNIVAKIENHEYMGFESLCKYTT